MRHSERNCVKSCIKKHSYAKMLVMKKSMPSLEKKQLMIIPSLFKNIHSYISWLIIQNNLNNIFSNEINVLCWDFIIIQKPTLLLKRCSIFLTWLFPLIEMRVLYLMVTACRKASGSKHKVLFFIKGVSVAWEGSEMFLKRKLFSLNSKEAAEEVHYFRQTMRPGFT